MTTEERIEQLEKNLARVNRRNRWVLAGAAICLGVGLVGSMFRPQTLHAKPTAGAPKEVRASRFVLVDDSGNTRATLGLDKGAPGLRLLDGKGKALAWLAIAAMKSRGSRLGLADENGKTRFTLSVNKDMTLLAMRGKNGKSRAMLIATKNGPEMSLRDENGKTVWNAP